MAKRKGNLKTATFRGRKYRVEIDKNVEGLTDVYSRERGMLIWADLDTRKGLRIAIHEALHASNWAASEKVVDRVSTDIGRFLWNLGYRRKV